MPTTITAQAAHPPTQTQTQVSTFRDFAGEWWDLHTAHLAPNTIIDYRWRLNGHLLNWFGDIPINQISARAVDEYKVTKLRDGRLCARSINMTLSLLCSILEEAVELELLITNPARGRRRRLPP
jgi:hypothetical protein